MHPFPLGETSLELGKRLWLWSDSKECPLPNLRTKRHLHSNYAGYYNESINFLGDVMPFRYAICNETFVDWSHEKVCEYVAQLGYGALELAPFTLAPLITQLTAAQRQSIRQQAEKVGLKILGLHWLLAKTEGFQVTSPDPQVRQKTAQYLQELAKAARDFGGDTLVFGSPLQRKIPVGATPQIAADYAYDTFAQVIPELERTGVILALEPLAPTETDFLQTAAETVALRNRLNHPNVQLHLDVKAMSSEQQSIPEVIRTNAQWLKHFHANDPNKRGPGFGDTDFVPIFRALKEINYSGWISVEVFDYTPDPVTIASQSLAYMKKCEALI